MIWKDCIHASSDFQQEFQAGEVYFRDINSTSQENFDGADIGLQMSKSVLKPVLLTLNTFRVYKMEKKDAF